MDDTRLWKLIDQAFRSYVETLLWANAVCNEETCVEGREIGDCEHTADAYLNWGADDFTSDDWAQMREDVETMVEGAGEDYWAYIETLGTGHFGHDFALTRNGHGAGFWDRGLGELGDRLAVLAEPYGSQDVLVSEEGVTLA